MVRRCTAPYAQEMLKMFMCDAPNCSKYMNLLPFVPSTSQQTAEDQSECLACSMALLQDYWCLKSSALR
eukprot:Em0022g11a